MNKSVRIVACGTLLISLLVSVGACAIKAFEHYLWGDEVLTLWISGAPSPEFLARVYSGVDGQLPIVYLTHRMMDLAGLSPYTMRAVMGAIFYIALLAIGSYMVKLRYKTVAVLLSFAFFLQATPGLHLSIVDLRGYSIYLIAFVAYVISLSEYERRGTAIAAIIAGISMAFFLNSHPFAVLFAFPILLICALNYRANKQHLATIAIIGIIGWGPALPTIFYSWSLAANTWFGTIPKSEFISHLFPSLSNSHILILIALLGALPILCKPLQGASQGWNVPIVRYSTVTILTGFAICIYGLIEPFVLPRYLTPMFIAVIVVVVATLDRFELTTVYAILFSLLSFLTTYLVLGNEWEAVRMLGKLNAARFAGVSDRQLATTDPTKSMFIAQDTSTLLPRTFYNTGAIEYIMYLDEAGNGSDSMILRRLLSQGFPTKVLGLEEIIQEIEHNGVERVILLGTEQKENRLTRRLSVEFDRTEVEFEGIRIPITLFNRSQLKNINSP